MVAFYDIEKNLHQALDELSGKFLNDLPEFKTVNPTVENVTEYLFTKIDKTLRDNGRNCCELKLVIRQHALIVLVSPNKINEGATKNDSCSCSWWP